MAGTRVVKSDSFETVYYVDDGNIRHAFPNRLTYESWFGDNFSVVEGITEFELSSIKLG